MKKHRGQTAVGYQWWEYGWKPGDRARYEARKDAVSEARSGLREDAPMSAAAFVDALREHLQIGDRYISSRVESSWGPRKDEEVYVNFVNLPIAVVQRREGGGAEAENNRASFWIRGFGTAGAPASRVKIECSNSVFSPAHKLRAKTGSPAAVAKYLAEFLNRIARDVPPRFTHTTVSEARRGKKTFETYASEVERALVASGVRPDEASVWISNHGSFIDQNFKRGIASTETADRILESERHSAIPWVDEARRRPRART
jgi:hypothetical protein